MKSANRSARPAQARTAGPKADGTAPSGRPTRPGGPRPHAGTTNRQSRRQPPEPADPVGRCFPGTQEPHPGSAASAGTRHCYSSGRSRYPPQRRNRHRSTRPSRKSPGWAGSPAAAASQRYHPPGPRAAPGRWPPPATNRPEYPGPAAARPDPRRPPRQPPPRAPQPTRRTQPNANTGSSAKSAPPYQHPPCARANAPHGSRPTSGRPPRYPAVPARRSTPAAASGSGSPNRTPPNKSARRSPSPRVPE